MKSDGNQAGRPRVSSRDTIEEAAAELFLEQSYAGTTIDEITRRAGVSRASFFNYFASKADLLWIDADHAIARFEENLNAGEPVVAALLAAASEVGSERVPLAVTQSDVMGTTDELLASGMPRVARVTGLIRAALLREAATAHATLEVNVRANVLAGAVVAAWMEWIGGGVSRSALVNYVKNALDLVQL